jgi:hypothetical protein
MSEQAKEQVQRRTSERRKLKLLKKKDEFRLSNPFRNSFENQFPSILAHQLNKM